MQVSVCLEAGKPWWQLRAGTRARAGPALWLQGRGSWAPQGEPLAHLPAQGHCSQPLPAPGVVSPTLPKGIAGCALTRLDGFVGNSPWAP